MVSRKWNSFNKNSENVQKIEASKLFKKRNPDFNEHMEDVQTY